LELLIEESLENKLVLDVGCGSGRLTFALSPYARKVVGIDISDSEIEKAKSIMRAKGVDNVEFHVADAEVIEYRGFLGTRVDVVSSNLCMSAEIIKRASRALDVGSPFVFACFHEDQFKELGGSKFSFGKNTVSRLLEASGFMVEYLEIEKKTMELPEKEIVEREYWSFPWARRRWNKLMRYLDEGGRRLTQSRLVVKARRV
jgi:SAM-dependent methyltransferase